MLRDFYMTCQSRRNIQKLVRSGILRPIKSFEQYTALVNEAKKNAEHRLFTNCYLMPDKIKRLIERKAFYQLRCDNGVAFIEDERLYYYLFVYIDLNKSIDIPKLDKNILAENVYMEDRMTEQQKDFDHHLEQVGFIQYLTYRQIGLPQIPPEKFWKKYHSAMKFLENDGKHICVPTNRQLGQFEKIYREEMDRYSQKWFTRHERKEQRDKGYLTCLADDGGTLYSIRIENSIHGGAIAEKKEYSSSGYAPALRYSSFKNYFENMPSDPQQQKKYKHSRPFGWIATTNTPSIRLHESLGMYPTGKAMHQFIMPGYASETIIR